MEKAAIGIMGGTGIYDLPGVADIRECPVSTPYGEVPVKVGILSGKRVAFLTRHGARHSISPGQINYRANLSAFRQLGVRCVYATSCSGSLNPEYPAGSYVVLEQFIDRTKKRPASFFENDGSEARNIGHVDLTHPYCPRLSGLLVQAGADVGVQVRQGATYVCMEGPRFETAAEIRMMRILGGDLVGHTQYPEAALAREAELCYASLGIVANMAAGICDEHVSTSEVSTNMSQMFAATQRILARAVELTPEDADCWCQHALEHAFV